MKIRLCLPVFSISAMVCLLSCDPGPVSDGKNTRDDRAEKKETELQIKGTWRLISGTLVTKGDTTTTYYGATNSFIKVINDTHFAFLLHDLKHGKDSAASFSAGGGRFTLKRNQYTEHLEYCSARNWEGHDFNFTVTIRNDTLVQSGIEKIESSQIERLNIETYVREN